MIGKLKIFYYISRIEAGNIPAFLYASFDLQFQIFGSYELIE